MTENEKPESAMQVDEGSPAERDFMPIAELKELERKIKSCFNFDRSESEHFTKVNELLALIIGRVSGTLILKIDQVQENFVY